MRKVFELLQAIEEEFPVGIYDEPHTISLGSGDPDALVLTVQVANDVHHLIMTPDEWPTVEQHIKEFAKKIKTAVKRRHKSINMNSFKKSKDNQERRLDPEL